MKMRGISLWPAIAIWLPIIHAGFTNESIRAPCDSQIYCLGSLLKDVQLSQFFQDSKTFVDLPTKRSVREVLSAYRNLPQPIPNDTLNAFLEDNFGEAGSELSSVESPPSTDPAFIDKVQSPIIKQFTRRVVDIWPSLTRTYNASAMCSDCASSFIPLNGTFVVAGGRFRELYFWDSFWIMEGLLRTGGGYPDIAKNMIKNFLGLVAKYQFVPNGSRIYYTNRSQPPMLTQMVELYVKRTNDTSIVKKALPMLIMEHDFWLRERSATIKQNNRTYVLNRYNVDNNQPRPESFREDFFTATNKSYFSKSGRIFPEKRKLSTFEIETLYKNLASGAESGADYSSRWLGQPQNAVSDTYFPLRSLNTQNIVPVELNSILYGNEMILSRFLYESGNSTAARMYKDLADRRSKAMRQVMWDNSRSRFFDYNMTAESRELFITMDNDTTTEQTVGAPEGMQKVFSLFQLFPFWQGAAGNLEKNATIVRSAFQEVEQLLDTKAGLISTTNLRSGQQWDEPNAWPPLQYVLMKSLRKVAASFPEPEDKQWAMNLSTRIAQRYLDATFCTWRATGGEIDGLPSPQLNGSQSHGGVGHGVMFEKYSQEGLNAVGGGGEYEVVEGFGWTNGVLMWVVDTFWDQLVEPECPGEGMGTKIEKRGPSAVELYPGDARWIKRF